MNENSFDIRKDAADRVLICAHRGSCGGNVPCNTLAAFSAALSQGADIIELDVAKSRDGNYFVFHPGMEKAHLNSMRPIALMDSKKVETLRYVNQDRTKTQFKVEHLDEVLDFLKGKCYLNVDKFWTDIPGITRQIRRAGVEKQVIVKTGTKESDLRELREYAPDLMFMPIVRHKDEITDRLVRCGINCIGAEILFDDEKDPVASDEYIDDMHKRGLLLFANAIVYNYRDVLSAGHNDDVSAAGEPEKGWGWLLDKKFDIIQTDWCASLKSFMQSRENK